VLPDDVRITAEAPPPKARAQHGNPIPTGLFLVRSKCATERRVRAEHVEECR
jgi:hypothetical protein